MANRNATLPCTVITGRLGSKCFIFFNQEEGYEPIWNRVHKEKMRGSWFEWWFENLHGDVGKKNPCDTVCLKGALADKYFRLTVINGGSISSRFSAQPILRRGCSRALPFSALVRSAPRTKIKAMRARGRRRRRRRDGAVDHVIAFISRLTSPQNSPSRARTGEAAAAFVADHLLAPHRLHDKSVSVQKKNSLIVSRPLYVNAHSAFFMKKSHLRCI